jgi:hypothetical protein
MQQRSAFIPSDTYVESAQILTRKIPAIQLECEGGQSTAEAKLGPILHLPAGSTVDLCGAGFNATTVKVRHHDAYFFVFHEDLFPEYAVRQN